MTEPVERGFAQQVTRYYDLYVPEGDGPFPLVVAMHGYAGDKASMMRLARRIEDRQWAIASLQGLHQHVVYPELRTTQLGFAFGWLTNFKPAESVAQHREAVLAVADDAASDPRVDAGRFFLLAFSQAVALNFRFAFWHPERVRGVVGVCGGIPGDWETEAYRDGDFDVLLVGGSRDEFYPPDLMEANAEALRRRSRSVEVEIFEAGHEVPRDSYTLINSWIENRVEGSPVIHPVHSE